MYVYVEQINDNKYYRGFGKQKSVKYKNIETNSTPVEEVEEKKQYYKLLESVTYTKQTVNNIDATGKITNTYEISIPMTVYGWEFDEIAWETSGIEVSPSNSEKIASLEEEKEMLKTQIQNLSDMLEFYEECIVELATIVYQ